jgi:NAD(P)-dependent dehydrogenase (short-subunit alcohol dehydrogenase family)
VDDRSRSRRRADGGPFRDTVAIVTGGASGIGRATGEELVRRGARVWLADIDAEGVKAAATGASGSGTARGVALDVTDPDAVRALVGAVLEECGRVDFMFNNAGVALFGDARHMSLEDWDQLIAVNFKGVVHGIDAVYSRMIEQRSGHIVNTASAAGLHPVPYNTAYAATKHAVVGLSLSLRIEAERYGVRVSAVCPGVIDTPMKDTMRVLGVDRAELLRNARSLYPVARCANVILAGVERNRDVIVVGWTAHFGWRLHRFAPRLMRGLTRRLVKRTPFAR